MHFAKHLHFQSQHCYHILKVLVKTGGASKYAEFREITAAIVNC
jgi:hypothetical protein